jgi:hypothetical protein
MEDLKPNITVAEIEQDIADLVQLRTEHALKEREAKDIKSVFNEKQEKLRAKLEALELDSYKGKAGSFSYKMREGFRVPKDLDAKKQFFAYLQEKGVFDELVSVNSQTLNSWAQAEIEAALENDNFDFQIPGLEKAQAVPKYSLTQGKGQRT